MVVVLLRGAGSDVRLPPPDAGRYGIAEDVQYLTGDALQQRLGGYRRLGVHWVRFQMIWSAVQNAGPDAYDWSVYDALAAGLRDHGLQPIVALGTTPPWARLPDCAADETCAPADPAAFGRFAGQAATRLAPVGVHVWEIWNEPNSSVFFKPAPDPVRYTAMLQAAAAAIRAADPQATILTGGTAGVSPGDGNGFIDPADWLSALYADGARDAFDGVAHHPYGFPRLPGLDGAGWEALGDLHKEMVAHGDGAKRIWATEFGAPTAAGVEGSVDEDRQAEILSVAANLWAAQPWTGPLVWFLLRDGPAADRDSSFGLERADGTPKPAYAVLRRLTGAGNR